MEVFGPEFVYSYGISSAQGDVYDRMLKHSTLGPHPEPCVSNMSHVRPALLGTAARHVDGPDLLTPDLP